MILSEFKQDLLSGSLNRSVLPDNTELSYRILTGLKLIAKETVVLRLAVETKTGYSILRRLDENFYIRQPVRPTLDDSDIDTDEELTDALKFYVLAGLERAKASVYMGMYHSEIDMNNNRLIESYLSDTTNQSDYRQPYV